MLDDLHAPAEAFDAFEIDESFTFGLNTERFRSAVSWARKRGDGDPVAIDVFRDPDRIRVTIVREEKQMKREIEWFGTDPNDIRDEPEMPNLNLPLKAQPGVEALRDAVDAVESTANHAYFTCDGTTFKVATTETGSSDLLAAGNDPDEDESAVEDAISFPYAVTSNDTDARSSIFSMDYLDDVTKALKDSKADTVTVRWSEEFPTRLKFQHEDWGFQGEYLIAPRIENDEEGE